MGSMDKPQQRRRKRTLIYFRHDSKRVRVCAVERPHESMPRIEFEDTGWLHIFDGFGDAILLRKETLPDLINIVTRVDSWYKRNPEDKP